MQLQGKDLWKNFVASVGQCSPMASQAEKNPHLDPSGNESDVGIEEISDNEEEADNNESDNGLVDGGKLQSNNLFKGQSMDEQKQYQTLQTVEMAKILSLSLKLNELHKTGQSLKGEMTQDSETDGWRPSSEQLKHIMAQCGTAGDYGTCESQQSSPTQSKCDRKSSAQTDERFRTAELQPSLRELMRKAAEDQCNTLGQVPFELYAFAQRECNGKQEKTKADKIEQLKKSARFAAMKKKKSVEMKAEGRKVKERKTALPLETATSEKDVMTMPDTQVKHVTYRFQWEADFAKAMQVIPSPRQVAMEAAKRKQTNPPENNKDKNEPASKSHAPDVRMTLASGPMETAFCVLHNGEKGSQERESPLQKRKKLSPQTESNNTAKCEDYDKLKRAQMASSSLVHQQQQQQQQQQQEKCIIKAGKPVEPRASIPMTFTPIDKTTNKVQVLTPHSCNVVTVQSQNVVAGKAVLPKAETPKPKPKRYIAFASSLESRKWWNKEGEKRLAQIRIDQCKTLEEVYTLQYELEYVHRCRKAAMAAKQCNGPVSQEAILQQLLAELVERVSLEYEDKIALSLKSRLIFTTKHMLRRSMSLVLLRKLASYDKVQQRQRQARLASSDSMPPPPPPMVVGNVGYNVMLQYMGFLQTYSIEKSVETVCNLYSLAAKLEDPKLKVAIEELLLDEFNIATSDKWFISNDDDEMNRIVYNVYHYGTERMCRQMNVLLSNKKVKMLIHLGNVNDIIGWATKCKAQAVVWLVEQHLHNELLCIEKQVQDRIRMHQSLVKKQPEWPENDLWQWCTDYYDRYQLYFELAMRHKLKETVFRYSHFLMGNMRTNWNTPTEEGWLPWNVLQHFYGQCLLYGETGLKTMIEELLACEVVNQPVAIYTLAIAINHEHVLRRVEKALIHLNDHESHHARVKALLNLMMANGRLAANQELRDSFDLFYCTSMLHAEEDQTKLVFNFNEMLNMKEIFKEFGLRHVASVIEEIILNVGDCEFEANNILLDPGAAQRMLRPDPDRQRFDTDMPGPAHLKQSLVEIEAQRKLMNDKWLKREKQKMQRALSSDTFDTSETQQVKQAQNQNQRAKSQDGLNADDDAVADTDENIGKIIQYLEVHDREIDLLKRRNLLGKSTSSMSDHGASSTQVEGIPLEHMQQFGYNTADYNEEKLASLVREIRRQKLALVAMERQRQAAIAMYQVPSTSKCAKRSLEEEEEEESVDSSSTVPQCLETPQQALKMTSKAMHGEAKRAKSFEEDSIGNRLDKLVIVSKSDLMIKDNNQERILAKAEELYTENKLNIPDSTLVNVTLQTGNIAIKAAILRYIWEQKNQRKLQPVWLEQEQVVEPKAKVDPFAKETPDSPESCEEDEAEKEALSIKWYSDDYQGENCINDDDDDDDDGHQGDHHGSPMSYEAIQPTTTMDTARNASSSDCGDAAGSGDEDGDEASRMLLQLAARLALQRQQIMHDLLCSLKQ